MNTSILSLLVAVATEELTATLLPPGSARGTEGVPLIAADQLVAFMSLRDVGQFGNTALTETSPPFCSSSSLRG
jgi:hypothetical protein